MACPLHVTVKDVRMQLLVGGLQRINIKHDVYAANFKVYLLYKQHKSTPYFYFLGC